MMLDSAVEVPRAGLAAPAGTPGIESTEDRVAVGPEDENLDIAAISAGGKAYTRSRNDENLVVEAHKGATRVLLLDGDDRVSRPGYGRGREEKGLDRAAVGSETEGREGFHWWQMGGVNGGRGSVGTILSEEWDSDDDSEGKAKAQEDESAHIGASDANPRRNRAGRSRIGNELPRAGASGLGVAYERGIAKRAVTAEKEKGGREGESRDGDGAATAEAVPSCDTSFPLATTLLAWASAFGVLAMYRLYPQVKDYGITSRSGENNLEKI